MQSLTALFNIIKKAFRENRKFKMILEFELKTMDHLKTLVIIQNYQNKLQKTIYEFNRCVGIITEKSLDKSLELLISGE